MHTPRPDLGSVPSGSYLERDPFRRCGITRGYMYELIRAGRFPRPVKIGAASRWPTSEIDAWIGDRIAESRAAQNGAATTGEGGN